MADFDTVSDLANFDKDFYILNLSLTYKILFCMSINWNEN